MRNLGHILQEVCVAALASDGLLGNLVGGVAALKCPPPAACTAYFHHR